MSQLLDLSITLTPPPERSPPEAIASITLRCDPQGLTHTGDLLTDLLTEQERASLRWYLEEYWKWPYYEFAQRGQEVEYLLADLGKRLYRTVFGSLGARDVLQAWRLQPDEQRQISIISDVPKVLNLPWELLHDEQGFLVLRARQPVSIVRRLPQRELAGFPSSFEPPLRVLLVTARPEDTGFVDPRSIARELLDEVQTQANEGAVELEFLRPPTLLALHERLMNSKRPPVHILHFDGHGTFVSETLFQDGKVLQGGKQGMLAFEDDEGKLDLVKAEDLAQVLQNSGVHLAVLTACQSAMSAEDNAFSSVAARLIQGGVDAVAAMSTKVLVASATRYVEAFYRALASGTPAPTAQERARQALHADQRRHIQRRNLQDEGTPVKLRDWWLPHFYQQRSLTLQPTKPARKSKKQHSKASSVRLNETMPAEPRYGFTGRAHELLQIERWLMPGKLVVIHGFGGVGKTALVRETADWLTRTKMYDGACFVSFEHGGDAPVLLSALGNFLGVYDANYNPSDPKVALARLKPALIEKRTLVIADNLESLLPGGEAPLEVAIRGQLWDTLLELARMGAGVMLTSRDTNFGDGRLAPGRQVAHLALGGLHPEDAYALSSRLLEDLGIDRARAPYQELRDLLEQLDHHPLAIQLVLPALRELFLAKIKADFGSLLPKFVDDTTTGRNRSLLASLDYSLRRLSEQQRALLPRLALFEGGASEERLLAITEISKAEWVTLRQALEQAALLTAEHIHDDVTVPFLRFHPVLAPYLRGQSGAGDPALHERYAQRYYKLADYLYFEDRRNPQPVRALVRRELPNLRRALALLLEMGELDSTSAMTTYIAWFLNYFGLERELDELRRQVAAAVASAPAGEMLTRAEYLREDGLGEDEYRKGNLRAAYTRFTNLLKRIEELPEGAPLGRGSYEHCSTLQGLARCLEGGGQQAAAEGRLREALTVIGALIKQQPDKQDLVSQRGMMLADFGDILREQGRYSQARTAYEEALKVATQQSDLRPQAVALGQLGGLALDQREYAEARTRYAEALGNFRALGEPRMEAIVWHQLGIVAQEQKEWVEAERCYRESLVLEEQRGNAAGVADTCNQLADVALEAGRPIEAEGWYKRTLELDELVHPDSPYHGKSLNNLARLLLNEVLAGHFSKTRLIEARRYAERALAIRETLDASSEIWNSLGVLASIADLEGRADTARDYLRRERETFAAFAGNRYHIDRQHGQLIANIAEAAKGNVQARETVEAALPRLEEKGWHIAAATHRIWAGEQDWHSLIEEMDRQDALLVLRVLETIAQPNVAGSTEAQDITPEQVIASLSAAIREALAKGDQEAFDQAFQALPTEEQQAVVEAIRYLQAQQEEEGNGESEASGGDDVVKQFEPLLRAIAVVAMGDAGHRGEIEGVLDKLEEQDCHIRGPVQRIWNGERDAKALTLGLDEIDVELVLRVLEIVGDVRE